MNAKTLGSVEKGNKIENRGRKRQYDVLLLRNVQMPAFADLTACLFRRNTIDPTEPHRVCSVKVSDLTVRDRIKRHDGHGETISGSSPSSSILAHARQ